MKARALQYQNIGGRVVAIGPCMLNLDFWLAFYRELFGDGFPGPGCSCWMCTVHSDSSMDNTFLGCIQRHELHLFALIAFIDRRSICLSDRVHRD